MTWTNPTPKEQVEFLRNIQRLLAEGLFTASYKFALLHALADLAVLKGDDTGAPLELDTKDIAEKFIALYWQHTRPYQIAGTTGVVLTQHTKEQARVIKEIDAAQRACGGALFRLKQTAQGEWVSLVSIVKQVVCDQPLWKLQTVGDERLDFLYDNLDCRTRKIMLKAGVAYCLRAFYELLRDMIQGAWVRFVQKVNANKLGNLTDLGTFLFGNERASLEVYRPILMDLQRGNCLYCRKPLPKQSQVDHFIPWSRYPTDLGPNFVLAHNACNHAKSDHLAAEDHLAAWADRNRQHQEELRCRLLDAALPFDLSASIQIAQWAYEQTEKANGQVWVMEKVLQHLGPTWRESLSA